MESSNTENLIVRYLLGELPENEADALEVRLLTDADALEQVQAAEYELIDQYVRAQMPAAQRERFESHYLASPLHRERVATARVLLPAADELPATDELLAPASMPPRAATALTDTAQPRWWRTFFATPTFAWSASLVCALLGAMIVWLMFERGRLQAELQAQQQRLQTLEGELAQQRATVEQLLAQHPATQPTLPPVAGFTVNDGGKQLALDAQGQLRDATGFNEQEQVWLRQTLQTARLPEAPAWIDLRVPHDELMGEGATKTFALQHPLSQALLTTTPTLRWQALPEIGEAVSYRVEIYDLNAQRVATSETLQKTSWQVRPALPAGKVYQWQVIATRKGEEIQAPAPPAPPARFAIIAASEAAAIAQARQHNPVSHLLLSTLYARNGLYAEAERELHALQKTNPASAQVKQLLAEIKRRTR